VTSQRRPLTEEQLASSFLMDSAHLKHAVTRYTRHDEADPRVVLAPIALGRLAPAEGLAQVVVERRSKWLIFPLSWLSHLVSEAANRPILKIENSPVFHALILPAGQGKTAKR